LRLAGQHIGEAAGCQGFVFDDNSAEGHGWEKYLANNTVMLPWSKHLCYATNQN
jgi:hypothetical protein